MELTFEEIKELIQLLGTSDVAELRLEGEAFKLRLRKAGAFAVPVAAAPLTTPAPMPVAVGSAGSAQPTAVPSEGQDAADPRHTIVPSPMVGTFYRAPAPDAAPYVQVGDRVEVGQPLCVIEAMKLFNEIESEVRGRIVKILVENGQPVEYGQPLFAVEPDAPAAGV